MKKYDFSFNACYEEVVFEVERIHRDPITEYGRAIVRADQDPFFNKAMIEAWKAYIDNNNVKWDS